MAPSDMGVFGCGMKFKNMLSPKTRSGSPIRIRAMAGKKRVKDGMGKSLRFTVHGSRFVIGYSEFAVQHSVFSLQYSAFSIRRKALSRPSASARRLFLFLQGSDRGCSWPL